MGEGRQVTRQKNPDLDVLGDLCGMGTQIGPFLFNTIIIRGPHFLLAEENNHRYERVTVVSISSDLRQAG